MIPEWKHAFRFAAQTADRLGLEMAIAGSPGWSESGGPWVKPEDGIKKFVRSETAMTGGKRFKGELIAPQVVRSATLGTAPTSLFSAAKFEPVLEASADGVSFTEVARFPGGTGAQYTLAFPPVTAKAMRVRFLPDA